ncbi:MAG: hypothetical protein JWN18_405 [Parcubacteria group bacterium]|nr:hypothetical protein [Parcubacteria group bacterium]
MVDKETLEIKVPPLPHGVLDKLEDKDLNELYLGLDSELDKAAEHRRRTVKKLMAGFLWFINSLLFFSIGPTDALMQIWSLATMGLLLVLFGNTQISSYLGPLWPIAGRFGQRIDRPTPPVVLVIFGWLLLFLVLSIFSIILYQKG